jgi:hypothetical protein
MGAIPPPGRGLIRQSEIGLVNEGRSIESVSADFATQVTVGNRAEVVVDEREQIVSGARISAGTPTQ